MNGFEFFSAARIVFGRGRATQVGAMARALGARALLVYNGEAPGAGGALDRVTQNLHDAGVHVTPFRQRGEPQVADVERGVAAAREAGVEVLVGLGGGSAIDCAKAVAGVLANGGSPLDYMEVIGKGQPLTKPATPWIAVPTTAGTGAEVTRNAVVGEPSRKFKASLRSEGLLPRVALVDPELGVTVPPDVTARSGMDALCQLIESYTSKNAQPMTDALATEGIRLAARSLRRAYEDGTDLDAREDMALAALLSGITLTNAGLGAVHGFAAPIGANFPAPHGAVCAVLLPLVMAANIMALGGPSSRHPTVARYATVGRLLGADRIRADPEAVGSGAITAARLVRDLHIPPLSAYGVRESDIPEIVALAKKASSMRYNPVVLPDDALADVLRRAL
jgi:alcohol dehydrogenase class IV